MFGFAGADIELHTDGGVIRLIERLVIQRDWLQRVEPIVALGAAFHAAITVTAVGWERPSTLLAAIAYAAVAVAGVSSRRGLAWRAAALPIAIVLIALEANGINDSITLWMAAAIFVYPSTMPPTASWWFIPWAAGAYYVLGILDGNLTEAVARSVIVVGAGVLAWAMLRRSDDLEAERAHAETELERTRGRLDVAFANASTGMAFIDLDGTILEANQALSDMFGESAQHLVGSHWSNLFTPRHRSVVMEEAERLIAGEVWSFRHEAEATGFTGKPIWVLVGATLVAASGDEEAYLFVNFEDISARVATEDTLRAREEHYRTLFGKAPIAIWEADYTAVASWLEGLRAEGVGDIDRYLRANPAVLATGLELVVLRDHNDAALRLVEASDADEVRRRFPFLEATPGMADALIGQFEAIWDDSTRAEQPASTRTLAGNMIEGILHWVVPVVGGRRDLSKVVLAFADFTASRKAKEALHQIEERLRAVLAAAPIFIFALDRNGVFTFAEGQALGSLALAPETALGRSVFELFRDSPEMVGAARRALSGESFITEVSLRDRVFEARIAPIWQDGVVAGVIGVANDVTANKRAAERLEQLVREKDRFVASVSHELRTPLTAVVGFTQELRHSLDELSPEDLNVMVGLAAEQAAEVADLVEDLLVAARADLDNVAVNLESIEVMEQIDLVMISWRNQGAPAEVIGSPAKVIADPIRLRQIVRNLLTNAERYGGDRVQVVVSSNDETTSIVVRDDGDGIPARDRAKIFDPYYRSTRPTTTASSVGLGLTVSRQLARLLGGDLTYDYVDGWSEFEITVPTG